MKTYIPKLADIHREWVLVDASGQQLGRLASQTASVLRGKHRAIFTPHMDTGDFVIVINAEQVVTTGRKLEQKRYFSHSTHPGGGRFQPLKEAMRDKPEWVVRKAVWGMLPHGPLGRKLLRKLKVYRGAVHPHSAQQPKPLALNRKLMKTAQPVLIKSTDNRGVI